jgi:hypothetical protein
MKKFYLFFELCAIVLLFSNCNADQSDVNLPNEGIDKSSQANNLSNKINSANTVPFTATNAALTTETAAETVFNNDISGWDTTPGSISSNTLKIALPAAAGSGNGMECRLDVTDNAKYELTFDTRFETGFDFAKGGKIGFGFAVGEGVTGGRNTEATVDNLGGSFRVMWRTANGVSYFHPYVYYKDMSGQFGTDFESSRYNNLAANTWYRIRLTIKVNTSGTKKDGYGKMEVSANGGTNYTKVWEKSDIRWSGATTAASLVVKTFYFSTFRGGSDSTWDGSSAKSIFFDNLSWKTIP